VDDTGQAELPLKYTPRDGYIRRGVGIVARMYTADDFPCLTSRDEERQCNREAKELGRLFASSPDLLAACKAAESFLRMIGEPAPPHPWMQLRDAIAAAEGRAP
jgi:hypothetical protein